MPQQNTTPIQLDDISSIIKGIVFFDEGEYDSDIHKYIFDMLRAQLPITTSPKND